MASTDKEGERDRQREKATQSAEVRTPTQLQLINFDELNLKGTTAQTCHKRQPQLQLQLQHTNAVKVRIIYTHEPRQRRQTEGERQRQTETERQRHSQRQVWRLQCINEMHNFVVKFWQFAYRKRTRALIAN